MRDYKKYERSFIVLTPESAGYALESRKLAGTALLEIREGRGRLTVSVHGLKATHAAVYKLYLISSGDRGTLGVPCGIIEPDVRGKAEKIWEFEPKSVGGSGIVYDDINVVAVIVRSVDLSQNEICAPLVGYRNGAVIWKSGFKEYSQDTVGAREAVPVCAAEPGEPPDTGTEAAVEAEPETAAVKGGAALAIEPPSPETSLSPSTDDEIISGIIKGTQLDIFEPLPEDDERIVERIIKESAPAAEQDSPLFCKLKRPLREHYERVRPLYEDMAQKLPEEKLAALNGAVNAALEYISDEAAVRIADVLSEIDAPFAGSGRGHRELASLIGEYAPAKVTELLAEALEEAALYLGEGTDAAKIITDCCGVWKPPQNVPGGRAEPEKREKIRLKSGIEGEFTLREPAPGEDHNQRFKEKLKSFSEQFHSLNGEEFRAPDELPEPELKTAEEQDTASKDNEVRQAAENVRAEHDGGRRDFDEGRLFKLFDGRKPDFPFHGARPGGPGVPPAFPPAVPPVIPIYDMRWIRISEGDFGLLPISSVKYLNSPFAVLAYRNYGHFILGVSGHGRKRAYYLGVPGAYTERDRVVAASLGFEGFLPAKGGKPVHGEFGYWVAKL